MMVPDQHWMMVLAVVVHEMLDIRVANRPYLNMLATLRFAVPRPLSSHMWRKGKLHKAMIVTLEERRLRRQSKMTHTLEAK